MRTFYAFLLSSVLLASAAPALAQPYYSFTQANEPYTEITGGALTFDDQGWHQLHVLDGSTFWFCGQSYTFGGSRQLWLNNVGFFNIDDAPNTSIFIAALLPQVGLVPADASAEVSYVVDGTPGDQVLKIQWKHYRFADGADDDHMDLQLWIHQASGVFELRYGPYANSGVVYDANDGPNVGYYYANYDYSTVYDRLWLEGAANTPLQDNALAPTFTSLQSIPAEGTVYRFTPLFSVTGIDEVTADAPFTWMLGAGGSTLDVAFTTPAAADVLMLMDLDGRPVRTLARHSDRVTIPLEGLAAGVYVLDDRTSTGRHYAQRFLRP